MTTIAYLDCIGGLAGDMLLAALLDAGAPHDVLHDAVRRLGLGDVKVEVSRTERHGIAATHVEVIEEAAPAERRAQVLIDAVARADLAPQVEADALDALDRLIGAESTIHSMPGDDLVLHEAGGSDTLIDIVGAFALLDALGQALNTATAQLWNTDQGSHFTGLQLTTQLEAAGVRISMDGKGRAHNNIFTECL